MLAPYLTKQAVIIGDHEQVSPGAVGQEIFEVEPLISPHLTGIPKTDFTDEKPVFSVQRESIENLAVPPTACSTLPGQKTTS